MMEDEGRAVAAGHVDTTPPDDPQTSATGQHRSDAQSAAGSMTGTDFHAYIGRGLRAVFDDVANQPIPDRFLDLMKKLG